MAAFCAVRGPRCSVPPSGDPQPSCPSGALLKDTPARGQSWQHGAQRGFAYRHLGWERLGDGAAPIVCLHAWCVTVVLGWALGKRCTGDGTVPQSLCATGKARCGGSGCSSVLWMGAWGLTVGWGSLCRHPLSWQHCGLPASLRHHVPVVQGGSGQNSNAAAAACGGGSQ